MRLSVLTYEFQCVCVPIAKTLVKIEEDLNNIRKTNILLTSELVDVGQHIRIRLKLLFPERSENVVPERPENVFLAGFVLTMIICAKELGCKTITCVNEVPCIFPILPLCKPHQVLRLVLVPEKYHSYQFCHAQITYYDNCNNFKPKHVGR